MDKKAYSPTEDKLILTLRQKHVSIDEICKQLRRSRPSISYRVYRFLEKLDIVEKNRLLGIMPVEVRSKVKPNIEKIIDIIEEEDFEEEQEEVDFDDQDIKEEEIKEVTGDEEEEIEVIEENEENNQYYFKEIYLSPTELDKLQLSPKHTEQELRFIEQLKTLQGKLIARVFELIELNMTEHQKKIVVLMLKNKTYNSMAVLLNINYTAIAHAIKGIKTKKHGKYHGGIERKLRKICMRDEYCLDTLKQLAVTRQELLFAMEDNSEVLIEGY